MKDLYNRPLENNEHVVRAHGVGAQRGPLGMDSYCCQSQLGGYSASFEMTHSNVRSAHFVLLE